MAEAKRIFMTYDEERIRYLEETQGIRMSFRYLHATSGVEFNVLDLPEQFFGKDEQRAVHGDRDAHRRVIRRAIDAGYDFRTRTVPQPEPTETAD